MDEAQFQPMVGQVFEVNRFPTIGTYVCTGVERFQSATLDGTPYHFNRLYLGNHFVFDVGDSGILPRDVTLLGRLVFEPARP